MLLCLPGCGWDSLLFTPRSFTPTEPQVAILAGEAEPGAAVQILGRNGRVAARGEADAQGSFALELPPEHDATNLTVFAVAGPRTTKNLVPRARAGETTALGRLDAASTALAQLATYEVQDEAGSTFQATPPAALAGLLAKLVGERPPAFGALEAVVQEILAAAQEPPFEATSARVTAALAGSELADRYRAALAAAAATHALEIRCDPSRLNVMFTVDLSGRGRDGNGLPQLIRQPTREGRAYLGFTADESSPIAGEGIPRQLTPNDVRYAMYDDGENGDEVAGDGVYTVVVPLPRGARILYKYTNGVAGEGFTGAEEWPGNARILQVEDVLTGRPDGQPDCLVIRRDSFGDEASNKNFVNLNGKAKERGGTVSFEADLGGVEVPLGPSGMRVGGLSVDDPKSGPPLTPAGVPEARENGVCQLCPAPLILDPEDAEPPELLGAERLAVDRVRVRFSEPLNPEDVAATDRWLYLDDAGRAIPVLAAAPSGADVLLTLEPTHPRTPARLRVRNLRDASVRGNRLEQAEVDVRADATPPRVLAARALSLMDLDPEARVPDPTVGELVELTFDEAPEAGAASDPTRYRIEGLRVLAAAPVNDPEGTSRVGRVYRVRLATEVQQKGRPYLLRLSGMRDPAGNALDQEVSFEGFALYRVTFGVVPGFAYASSDGSLRGLPRGEALYLTGTPLAAARDLEGRGLSVTAQGYARTDLTGWPQFEMTPGARAHQGQPIYELTVLLPKGSWAYKAAHGVEGEYVRPPTTLEKVYKTLATANDATGVRVDPVTLTAENGLSYAGAALSESGDEPQRATVVFKREAPDEVCEVQRDTVCPFIVVGTWRDLVLDQGGRTRDYDDGLIALPPHRPGLPDVAPPRLLDARARDSFSVLLSFDEALDDPARTLEVRLERADDGFGLRGAILATTEVRPHQAVLRVEGSDCQRAMLPGRAYTVRYRGARDRGGRADRTWRSQTVLAPEGCAPFSPLTDNEPPRIVAVTATDLNEVVVRFDERLDPATVRAEGFGITRVGSGQALPVTGAEVLPDRSSVRLQTETQAILEPYRLTVSGIGDAADPPNLLGSVTVDFVGFGDREPPEVLRVQAIDRDRVLVVFDEPLETQSATDPSRYRIEGLSVIAASFSGDPGRRSLAFSPALAPRIREAVVLTTSAMSAGAALTLEVTGVRDLSGNPGEASVAFTGVGEPPRVDVILEYEVSDGVRVAGAVPSRAISLAELARSREGVFILGARTTGDHGPAPGKTGPVNEALGGFGVEGQPLDGIEPQLLDNGVAPDRVAGDGVFTILVPRVPLGTTMIWKAFAPYSTRYRDQNPGDTAAAFADALPGPSVFSDGQEYPGNENGAVILGEGATGGQVRVRCLFGDEVTYKKHSGSPAYVWVFGDR